MKYVSVVATLWLAAPPAIHAGQVLAFANFPGGQSQWTAAGLLVASAVIFCSLILRSVRKRSSIK